MSKDDAIQLSRVTQPDVVAGRTYLPVKPFLEISPDGYRSKNYIVALQDGNAILKSQNSSHGGTDIQHQLSTAEFLEMKRIVEEAISEFESKAEEIMRGTSSN